ncbi:unnamed protein product [Musa hybrid cultivar]
MEGSMAQINHVEGEEEYVLLDLDDVCVRADIPANAPYVLSGLDTAKPVLVIGDLKLLLELFEENVGKHIQMYDLPAMILQLENTKRPWEHATSSLKVVILVLVNAFHHSLSIFKFSIGNLTSHGFVDGAPTVTCSETKPSETNVLKDKQFLDSKQAPSKQVKPIASLHKILKFKLVSEDQNEMAEGVTTSFS